MTLVLLSLAVLLLALAVHPFTTYPLSLWLLSRMRADPRRSDPVRSDPSGNKLRFAVCTCAYNEERVIERKLENLLALRTRRDVDILVYVDASSDDTAAICASYDDRIELHVARERHGKTHGMNLLVSQCDADIVVFTDANVMLADDVLDRLETHFAADDVGCVCGHLRYTNDAESVTANTGSLYWRIEEGIKRLETATGSVIGADGSLFAIRRDLHVAPPDHIIDDMFVSLMILCRGRRVIQVDDVVAYEASASDAGEEFRRKVRIACQAFNVHRLLWPRLSRLDLLSRYKYLSHKLIRWVSIYLLAVSWLLTCIAFVAAGWWVATIAVFAAPTALWMLGSRWPVRPFSQLFDIVAAFAGTGLGVWRSLRGDRFQTWAPAASVRKQVSDR